ncbi:hypothetical protein SAMN05660866_02341 [Maribacter arcticus]|uniref:Uncharacterized protein n=1 Tax=Maribacter arcticus TaxID=561365 RepID=A0A1T5CNB5_9FLAO|nr:hypothetical protein SAMN05660866_02341 [Maribacter arcticus]
MNLKSIVYKLVSYLLVTFILSDILIIVIYILKDYGEPTSLENINKTILIFLPITIVLIILERIFRKI